MELIKKQQRRRAEAKRRGGEDAPGGAPVDAELAESTAEVLDEIDCCLAEVGASDEDAARIAFEKHYENRGMGRDAWLDRGTELKAQYAHTQYVQQQTCCSCGCPWRESYVDE